MSNPSFSLNESTPYSKIQNNQKISEMYDNNANLHQRRAESAITNFTSNTHHNIFQKNKNIGNQINSSENSSYANFSNSKNKREFYKPKWKYSYYVNKNDILSLNNLNKNPEIKNSLCDYKDIDKRPKPIVYSWTKPRMVKIIENNSLIEEEVKSHFWKYSYLFENNQKKPPGKLLSLMITQLSQGYGNYEGGLNLMNLNKKGYIGDDGNFNNKIFYNQQWKVPGVYKRNTNNYEPIKIKRPKTAFNH